ncbi:hypothetical protein [Corynebacterium uropygiale]|nr:hypothetical protein [Corynebacterium uropygiale]
MSSITDFPVLADAVATWALALADWLRPYGINFPPPDWGFH